MKFQGALGNVPPAIAEVKTVSKAFARWKRARKRLERIQKRILEERGESLSFLISDQNRLNDKTLVQFQRYVVLSYWEWFQQIVVSLQINTRQSGLGISFLVYARWNIWENKPITDEEGNIYRTNIFFDAPMVSELIPDVSPHLFVVEHPKPDTFSLCPIPVDYVDKVEGCPIITKKS